jgi:hypothetical protein
VGQVRLVEGAPSWRGGVVLGVMVGAVFVITSSFGATAAWASTGAARVVNGCTIRTDAPPSGESCNLRGANLVNGNFASADLANADLANADLADANFAGANLAGTDLSGAKMAGADLTGANLTGANLARADLAGALWHDVTAAGVTWDSTVCPDFSDSTGDGGSCNAAPASGARTATEQSTNPSPAALGSSTISAPYVAGQSTNLSGLAIGGAGALAFTGFATAKVALLGTVLVAVGLVLLFLPAPAKRKAVRAGQEPVASGR